MDNHDVIALLDTLYNMVTEAWGVPLGNDKCIIERERAIDIINEIKANLPSAIAEAKAFLDEQGVAYKEYNGTTVDEVGLAVDSLITDGVDAVFTPTDNTIMAAEQAIYEIFAEAGIPHYAGADSFALWGAFCGYGVNYATLGTATGDLVVDILVNGADPATTPVVTFDNGNVSVNTETCAALGYDLDAIKAAFEPIATEFIELTTQQEFD